MTQFSHIVLATNNAGKLREFSRLFADMGVEITPQSEFQLAEAVEDGLSFVENALIKARHAARQTGLPAIADDSGLVVDALDGQPGIYSSRYAGETATNEANNAKLLQALSAVDTPNRSAHFRCCIVFIRHETDPAPLIAEARWDGRIAKELSGHGGFGYDPLFYVPSHQCSAAELSADEKNRISHRGQAMTKLKHLMSTELFMD